MCGLCGIFHYGVSERVREADVIAMRDMMIHRGPDDCGLFVSPDGRVGLGHRRLSIIDLSPLGRQPMADASGKLWVSFNGEIYNFVDLRPELERKGHKFRSRSDTEVILYQYLEDGDECVRKFRGIFAFALYDGRDGSVLLARDHLGVKPLYYTFQNGRLLFASEIKAFTAHPHFTPDVEDQALFDYLTFIATPCPRTMFKGVKKLYPGTYLKIGRDGNAREVRYWDALPRADGVERLSDPDAAVARVRRDVEDAVRMQQVSDVPVGVFLSGGVDSSTITALMAARSSQPVRTFSVAFRDQEAYNELEYARKIAKLFKTDHHEIVIDYRDALGYVPQMIRSQDEPIADWVCIPLYFVSKLVRDAGVIVVQVGEGSDEQYFGYLKYMEVLKFYRKRWRPFMRLPKAVRKAAYAVFDPLLDLRGYHASHRDALRRAAEGEELFWGGAVTYWDNIKSGLLKGGTLESFPSSHGAVLSIMEDLRRARPDASFMEGMQYLEFRLRLPELLLMRVDKITMSTSIEARVPYLDFRSVENSLALDDEIKIRGGEPKWPLKKAVEDLLPHDIIYRRKQGFGAPVFEWLRGPFGEEVRRDLLASTVHKRGYFNRAWIEHAIEAHRSGREDNSWPIWVLYNFTRWYDIWVEGKDRPAAAPAAN